MADLCEEPDILCQLRNVIMSGDFDELTKLTSNLESSTVDTYLAPIYEELKQINVSLNEDVENYIINFLVNARFFTECTEENKDQKVSLEDITKRIDIIVNLIDFLLKKYSLVSQVDDIFVFICRKLAINLHVLKHQMRSTYHKLPWEEMEFYLVAYIITITKPDQADDIFHLIIDKKSLIDYLDAFSSGLSKIELNNKTINQKLRLGNRTQIIESVNQTNSKFKTLYYHYDIIRDVASLRRIDYYINACTDLIFFYDSDIDTLMLERALQVIGEYLKSTPESPNVSENVHKMLVYSSPNRLKEIVTSLRDSLSHVDTLLQKQEIEDNQPRRFFRDLQNDLKKVHVEIRNILFKRKLAALQLFTNKILDCTSMSEILALKDNMSQVTIEDDLNIIWLKEIETVVDLIKQLESEIGSLTEQEECLFQKLRQEIMMKKNKASETMLAYQKLSMHLLTCLNEIQETNTLENVKNSFRIVSNLLSIYLNTGDFKKARYIIQSLKSSIDARLSFKNIEKVGTTINEILDLIVLKSDKVGDINRFKTKLETVCVSNKEVYVNELIENAVKCLECNKDKEILVKACDSKRSIYKTKMKLLNLINNGEISNSDSPKYRDLLKKLKIKEQNENTFIQNCVSGNMTVCKDIVSKVDDSYGNLMKKFSETNIFAYRKQEIAFKTFLTSLKLKKFPLDMVINNFTTGAKQEIKNFFTYRLKLLKTTLSVGEEANVLEVMKKFNSDQKVRIITELIVLDLMNVLESAALFIDDKLYLDDFSPLLLGKSLRNYLAHGNILIEILPFDILTSVVSNAFRLIQEGENIFDKQNILIGKNLSSDVFKSKNIFQEMEHVEVQNALYSAVSHHNLFDIQALIEKGANIKGKDINGFTVLHHAASTDNLEAYMFFMSCNLDCLTENKLKQNPLDVAIMRGSNKIFDFCLQQIEFPIDYQKLICTAAKHGQIQMVKKLLDICSKVPGDALLEATKGNYKETVAILLENQHKLVKNDNYTKCLHFAALFGHLDVANILLSYGFKVNSVLDEGLTPLHCAIQNDHANIVQLLLESGAKVDIDTANLNSSKSSDKPASILPFHFTKISDTTKQKLVKSETHDDEAASKSPSQLAEIGDNIPDRNLDESETNPNKPSSTSLSHLTESGDITDELEADTAQKAFVLLSHFAEIDFCPTDQSSSASSIRDRIGLSNLAQLFSKVNTNHAAGQRIDVADTFICDVLGIPPKDLNLDESDTDLEKSAPIPHLHLACMFGFKDIVEILIRHGAKLDYPFKNSFTPIHFATAFGHKNIVELLRTYEMDKTLAPNGISLMRLAIENNHLDLTEYLIDEGADINHINKEGFTALHLACQYGMVSVLDKLLQIGVDVTLQTFSGNTPLHVAVEAGQEDIVKYLLGHSSKTSASNDKVEIGDILYVNLSNHEGIAPIHVACESGNIKIIEMLLAHKAEVNKTNHNKQTPLYFAIEHNHTDIVNRLILSGADVQAVDVDENTPLHLATRNGEKDVVKVLINKGADINVRRKDHITPLHIASSYGQEEIVKELVEAGGLVNAVTTTGITPLYSAAKNGNYRLVRYLIEKGADINKCDNDGVTPLHFACRNGYTDVVELVIENGADISALDDGGATPLHLACLHGHLDIVELFIEAGMDINLPSDTGETPLHLAAESGSSSLVLFLLRNAAKNNVTDLEGFNPLHVAAQKGHEKVASSLIQSGISVNSKSSSGVTPLHMAAEGGSKHVIRFLLEKGAAVDEIESEGYTPLHIAAQYGNKDAVELLLDAGADVDLKTQGGLTAEELASQHDREEVLMSFHEEKESKLSNLRLAHLDSLKDIYKAVKIFGHGTDIEAAKNLLDSGVDANSNLDGLSLLDFAVYNCNEKMVSLLISNGADVNYQNGRVNSPLVLAADLGFSQIVEILLNNGANVNLINKSRTPLGAAVTNGHFECVKLLLNNGSDVYVRDSHDTVLHQATVCGNVDVLKLLLEEIKQKGNEDYINEKDSEGDTPLMWAIENKLYDVSKVLLDFGANVNLQNNDGMTALHWTVKVGDLDLLELLLNQPSVDVSIKNKNGEDIITVFKTKYNCSEDDRAKQFLRILDLRMV